MQFGITFALLPPLHPDLYRLLDLPPWASLAICFVFSFFCLFCLSCPFCPCDWNSFIFNNKFPTVVFNVDRSIKALPSPAARSQSAQLQQQWQQHTKPITINFDNQIIISQNLFATRPTTTTTTSFAAESSDKEYQQQLDSR